MHIWKLLPLAFAALASVAVAAPQSPELFLKDIYSHYTSLGRATGKGVNLDKPADFHRYFTDGLTKLVMADEDAAAKSGDVPTLDGDPFVDAQDWEITHLSIHIDSQTADHAQATVRFDNIKEPKVLHISLVMTPAGWRIDDIVWPGNEGTFRGLYKKAK
jgi:hypothetical protein